jgi:CubicO group peptidase (beta-lactamase class C family)
MNRLQLLLICGILATAAGFVPADDSNTLQASWQPIDDAVKAAIGRGELPGAVVMVVCRGDVVFHKAYGQRSKQPEPTLMTEDTVFDLASLTKPIATATAIMLLLEDGKLRVQDPVSQYLPAFTRKETEGITLEHLLVHTSGLIADNALEDYQGNPEQSWKNILSLNPRFAPGSKFVYSDVGYMLLGKVVEQVSGMPLDQFTARRIFTPLGMSDTGYRPQGDRKKRCAPTDRRDGAWIPGEVHDPRSYRLGGVAGHAGLFSTAADMAVYARMLLDDGRHQGKGFLKPETVRLMTTPRKVPTDKGPGLRTYGWDMDTSYSANRGAGFPKGVSFGHTGFTGTSIWLDPQSRSAVIFLSNRLHPDGKGNVTKLRGEVATIAAKILLK